MTTQTSVDVTVYSNEDLSRQFNVRARDPGLSVTVVTPTLAQTVAFDLTGAELKIEVRDAKSRSLLFTASTDNSRLAITDAAGGIFTVTVDYTVFKTYVGRSMVYDLLLATSSWTNVRRLWGGAFVVSQGVTTPDLS